MKYLSTRNDFLLEKKAISLQNIKIEEQYKSSLLIQETFENDITWGGSLIGRLINSTIRVAKIYYKTARITFLIPQLRKALDDLVEISRLSEQQRKSLLFVKFNFLFEEIVKVVNSNKKTGEKVGILLGNETESNPGLVKTTIQQIEKLEGLTDKDSIIDKLNKFSDELKELKNSIGELPEPEEEKTEGDSNKIFLEFFKLLDSIKQISEILKKQNPQPQAKPKQNIQKNKEYTYTDENGKKITVKVVDIQGGGNTDQPSKIIIVPKNPTDKFGNNTKKIEVDAAKLTESFIFEDANNPNPQTTNEALKKIKNVFFKNNIFAIIPKMDQLKKDYDSGDEKYKKFIKEIISQIILNETTIGQPLSLQALMEALNVQQTVFGALIKPISICGKYLLPFKENMDELSKMGELKDPIKKFIESYDNCKKLNSESKKSETDETQSTTQTEEENKVKSIWRKYFSEDEEKKYLVKEVEAKKLQESVDENDKVDIDVKNGEQYDRILRIVEIFGKAYRMYAVDEIPSGRPDARISQKTFREYEYIGKDGSQKSYEGSKGPGYGPWAARITYEKWQDGVMDILQDTKYRTVLANSEFVNLGPNQKKGSGLTLFTFMNDMLNEGGPYSNFRQRRHALLTKYFGGNAAKLENGSGSGGANDNPPIDPDNAGTPNELNFFSINQIKSPSFFEIKNFTDKNNFLNTFLLVRAKSTEGDMNFIIYIDDYVKDLNGHKLLIIKCHKLPPGTIKQSMISLYLKDKLSSKTNEANEEQPTENYKLGKSLTFVENQPIYWGLVELNSGRVFEEKKNTILKLSLINDFTANKPIETYDLTFGNVKILAYYSDKDKKNHKLIVDKINQLPRGDKTDITSIIKQNGSVQSKFGVKDRPKEKEQK